MDTDLNTLKTNAYSAANDVSTISQTAPSLLAQLKQNLVGIFTKDNPVMKAREGALTDYLNTPSATRASILPSGLPVVEGSNLNLSPTQQNAITTARSNAALVPLVGLNEIIKNQYGTIGDIVSGAGTAYDASVSAAKNRATTLLDLYKTAVAEEDAKRKAADSGGLDLASIIESIRLATGLGGNGTDDTPSGFFDLPGSGQPTPTYNSFEGDPLIAKLDQQNRSKGTSGDLDLSNINLGGSLGQYFGNNVSSGLTKPGTQGGFNLSGLKLKFGPGGDLIL